MLTAIVGTTSLAAPQTVTLSVPGMTCAACPITVERALSRIKGVESVDISYSERRAVVHYGDTQTNHEQLAEALTKAGYPAQVAHAESDDE
jgi:mercuric ion binding protein